MSTQQTTAAIEALMTARDYIFDALRLLGHPEPPTADDPAPSLPDGTRYNWRYDKTRQPPTPDDYAEFRALLIRLREKGLSDETMASVLAMDTESWGGARPPNQSTLGQIRCAEHYYKWSDVHGAWGAQLRPSKVAVALSILSGVFGERAAS